MNWNEHVWACVHVVSGSWVVFWSSLILCLFLFAFLQVQWLSSKRGPWAQKEPLRSVPKGQGQRRQTQRCAHPQHTTGQQGTCVCACLSVYSMFYQCVTLVSFRWLPVVFYKWGQRCVCVCVCVCVYMCVCVRERERETFILQLLMYLQLVDFWLTIWFSPTYVLARKWKTFPEDERFNSACCSCCCRLSTAGGSTASLSLCPVTRQWWWSTAMTTTQTCSRYSNTPRKSRKQGQLFHASIRLVLQQK